MAERAPQAARPTFRGPPRQGGSNAPSGAAIGRVLAKLSHLSVFRHPPYVHQLGHIDALHFRLLGGRAIDLSSSCTWPIVTNEMGSRWKALNAPESMGPAASAAAAIIGGVTTGKNNQK